MNELLFRNHRAIAAAVAAVIVIWAATAAVRVLSPLTAVVLCIFVAYAIYYAYERGRENGSDDQSASMALLCELTETQEQLASAREQLAEEQAVVEALTSQFSPDQAQP